MQIHNSALVRVPAGLVLKGGGLRKIDVTVRYGLIKTATSDVCLVDTGYGRSVTDGRERSAALKAYNFALRPRILDDNVPLPVLSRQGFTAGDVSTIVLTHFHADHVAGLRDFPKARMLASRNAVKALQSMGPARAIANGIFTELIPRDLMGRIAFVEDFPLRSTGTALGDGHDLFGDGSYLSIALPGHASGHFGVFWRTQEGPQLYATDVAWLSEALLKERPAALATAFVFHDTKAARETRQRVRNFATGGGTVVLCHDVENTSP